MVWCWISIMTTSGIPVAQFSSANVPIPFSIQGILSALQSNASIFGASIELIETDVADVAYYCDSELTIVCNMGHPIQKLAKPVVERVQSLLILLDYYRNQQESRQFIKDVKSISPVFTKLLQKSNLFMHWIGVPLNQLMMLLRSFSDCDCAAIASEDGLILRSSKQWRRLNKSDAWSIIILGVTSDRDHHCDFQIKILEGLFRVQKKLIVVQVGKYILYLVTACDGTESAEIAAALNQLKETEVPGQQIDGGFGVQGYLVISKSDLFIWLKEDDQLDSLKCAIIEEYCRFLEGQRLAEISDHKVNHLGQYSISENRGMYMSKDVDGNNIIVAFTRDVPVSCYEHVVKDLSSNVKLCMTQMHIY